MNRNWLNRRISLLGLVGLLTVSGCGGTANVEEGVTSKEEVAAEVTENSTATEGTANGVSSEEVNSEEASSGEVNPEEGVASETSEESKESEEPENSHGKIADASEKAEAINVVEDSMVAISGEALKDGEYTVTVDSSSSMFRITDCVLQVKEGRMTAVMTMGGSGYAYLYPGTPEEAAGASEDQLIPCEEKKNGDNFFTFPIEALDAGVNCAAFSKKKEQWYDRVLVFRADSLPEEAFKEARYTTIEDLSVEDGTYQVEVTLEGGSGRAKVDSPTTLKVEQGKAYATITWSSPNYDYMIVDGEKYLPINTEGNSVFEIPVKGFGYKIPVKADTTAMSTPKEIEYTLFFESELK